MSALSQTPFSAQGIVRTNRAEGALLGRHAVSITDSAASVANRMTSDKLDFSGGPTLDKPDQWGVQS